MKILITGACGFVGSSLVEASLKSAQGISIIGVDNLMRPGSELNRIRLRRMGVEFIHADIRCASDFDSLPPADWVIDAAANPSVLAGVRGTANGTSRQLLEHNLLSMIHVLEYCKAHHAGLIVLSSSRVYSIRALTSLPLRDTGSAFELNTSCVDAPLPSGISNAGIGPDFPTTAPVSLYGSTKLAAEVLALEYGDTFRFPVWINRCGVMAGPGQFGTPDQGIFAYWVNAFRAGRPLRFTGFDGRGKQVRDALHPSDLASLLLLQMQTSSRTATQIYTAGGGMSNAMSLQQLHQWCAARFGVDHPVASEPAQRPFDVPWVVMDNAAAQRDLGWAPAISVRQILAEIGDHAEKHPDWLQISGGSLA